MIHSSTQQTGENIMTKQQQRKLQQITNTLAQKDENLDFSIMEAGNGTLVFQASNANGPWYVAYASLTAYIGKLGGVKVFDAKNLSI
jgi:hypothetical protein